MVRGGKIKQTFISHRTLMERINRSSDIFKTHNSRESSVVTEGWKGEYLTLAGNSDYKKTYETILQKSNL